MNYEAEMGLLFLRKFIFISELNFIGLQSSSENYHSENQFIVIHSLINWKYVKFYHYSAFYNGKYKENLQ